MAWCGRESAGNSRSLYRNSSACKCSKGFIQHLCALKRSPHPNVRAKIRVLSQSLYLLARTREGIAYRRFETRTPLVEC